MDGHNFMEEYTQRWTEEMKNQPEMTSFREGKYQYVIVKDTKENRAKFEIKYGSIDDDNVFIYFNTPTYYNYIVDGMLTRAELKAERERNEKINNPEVDEEILAINSKESLLDYLINEIIENDETLLWEYSVDFDVDRAEMEARHETLKKLISKYL